MEVSAQAQVGTSSPSPRQKPSKTNRRSKSPTAYRNITPSAKGKIRAEKEPEDIIWNLLDPPILRERRLNGRVQYYMNWADIDPETGERYASTWLHPHNVSRTDRADWQQKKRDALVETVRVNGQTQHLLRDGAVEIEAARPAKRSRITSSNDSVSQEQTPSKRPRRAGTVETARFQSVSQESFGAQDTSPEVKDSYEEGLPLSSGASPHFRVEITVPDSLDRGAYATAIIDSSSQPSQPSQLSSSSISQDRIEASRSQFKTPERPRSDFVDDEYIVPDSQEQPGSVAYQPSETPNSITGRATGENIQANIEPDFESINFRNTQWISTSSTGSIKSQVAEPLSNYANSNYRAQPNLIQPETSQESPPTTQSTETSLVKSPAIQTVPENSNTGADEFSQSSNSTSRSNAAHSAYSRSQDSSSHLVSPPRERGTWSEEGRRILSDLQPNQSSLPEEAEPSSSFPFQTQFPSHLADEETRPPLDHSVPESASSLNFDNAGLSQQSQVLEELESQTIGEEGSHSGQSVAPTLRSISWSENIWNSAKVISTTPTTPPPAEAEASARSVTVFNTAQENPQSIATKDFALSAPKSVVAQVGPNTPGFASTRPGYDSLPSPESSKHLSPESSEHILPSIEKQVDIISLPGSLRPLPPSGSSNYPVTHASNPPARPSTTSPPKMDGLTPQEQKAAMKEYALQFLQRKKAEKLAKAASEKAAPEETSKAASSIPQSPITPVVSQPIPLRDILVESPIPETEPSVQPSTELEFRTSLQIAPTERDEFFVPLPMNAITRDIYTQTIKKNKYQRFAFLNDEDFDPGLVGEIDTMISELDLLCSHQDLISDDYATQRISLDEVQAKYAEGLSTKCMFVAELLRAMRLSDKHVAILVRPGRMLEIVEALLRYHGFIRRRQDRPEYSCEPTSGTLKVSLIPTGHNEKAFAVTQVSIVIAFDSTFGVEPYLKDLRTNPFNPQNPSPLISLLVSHSVEHLKWCFDKTVKDIERKMRLVSCLSQIAGEVGKLSPDYLSPPEAAKEISNFVVVNGSDPDMWPCLPMPKIEELDQSIDPTTQPESGEAHQRSSAKQSYAISPPALGLQPAFKRQLVEEYAMDIESPKRQRFTPSPGEQANNAEMTYARDTAFHSVTDKEESRPTNDEEAIATREETSKAVVSSLMQRVSDLETQLREKEASEAQLRRSNLNLESRDRDVESSMSEIQPKYQEALNDRGNFEHELKETLARANTLKQKHDARVEEVTKLKEQKQAADAALTEARTALASSTIPEIAEMEKLKEEIRTLNTEKERFQRRISNMSNELDYMRNNYQTASASAAESASELVSAQAEIEALRAKASENRVRIHEIQSSNEVATYLSKIRQLKAENEELEKELEKRGIELAAVMNGRRATRGTSVPRSPRMGQGTMSPGPARTIGRVMQMAGVGGGSRSRGNSPASGELTSGVGRPYTNLFGDPLYPQPQAGSRFGNHLQ